MTAQFRSRSGVVVARSCDGVNFKPVCEVSREAFGAASWNVRCLADRLRLAPIPQLRNTELQALVD
jgi:hypothetical protein